MKSKLEHFGKLLPAEQKLADDAGSGFTTEISKERPSGDPPHDVKVRASFIRYLATGGCENCRVSYRGLRVDGVYISGDEEDPRAGTKGLDIESASLIGDFRLANCFFPDRVILRDVSVASVNFNGSMFLAGISADRLNATGNVIFRGAEIYQDLRLLGAEIGGNLTLESAVLHAKNEGRTLKADRLKVGGTLFLRANTDKKRGAARDAKIQGGVGLARANIGALNDSVSAWPNGKGSLSLNGLVYGAFTGIDVNHERRLEWLGRLQNLEASGNLYPWDAYDDSLSSARGGVDGEAGGVLER